MRARHLAAAAALLTQVALLSACAGPPPPEAREASARILAAEAGLGETLVSAGPFTLTTFSRIAAPGGMTRVYLEGDGYAWATRQRLSDDPTPANPVALRLAARDPAANVVYIARPCQYGAVSRDAACHPRYWSSHRFAPDIVAAMTTAVEAAADTAGAARVDLVGFSGGGALAALVAGRSTRVATVRTVAGNLDTAETARLHGVSPLTGSLNPADEAGSLRTLPQLHFSGRDDAIIPASVAEGYVRLQAGDSCAQVVTVPGNTHGRGWAEQWPELLRTPLPCGEAS